MSLHVVEKPSESPRNAFVQFFVRAQELAEVARQRRRDNEERARLEAEAETEPAKKAA